MFILNAITYNHARLFYDTPVNFEGAASALATVATHT